jgi:hypothetical protein
MSNFDYKTSKEDTVPTLRSEDNIKMDHRVRECEGVGCIKPVEYKIEIVGCRWLSDYELSKEDITPLC